VNLIIFESIIEIGSDLIDFYRSKMNVDLAHACTFLTAEILYDCSVFEVF
jgi:hypothetical protein